MPVCKRTNIQPKRILVITLRYLGDTLLITPLLSSLKQAYPDAELDVLLPENNLGMLEGNQDVARLISFQAKPSILKFVRLLITLFQRYDIAISTQAGDRPILCAILAGKFSMGFVPESGVKNLWKRLLLKSPLVNTGQSTHPVLENLRFCGELNINPCYRLSPPRSEGVNINWLPVQKYVVLHVMPQWRYKQWHEQGWVELGYYLCRKGYLIVLTGGSQERELDVLCSLQSKLPPATRNLAGKLSLADLTVLIEHASIFIGPDTGVTHLAAATGVQTLALFGPTDPKVWGPWPLGYAKKVSPFMSVGVQITNNVYLIQGQAQQGCVPCQLEGCFRHRESSSACLDNLSAKTVIGFIDKIV